MNIESIINNPSCSLRYMERLVNDGSPSNFTFRYMTSKETNPLYVDSFYLYAVKDSECFNIYEYGDLPNCLKGKETPFLIHPDWDKMNDKEFKVEKTSLCVYPTSSSRTVKVKDSAYYIKMHYPGIIGRITRELRHEHIMSSLDVSFIIDQLIKDNKLSPFFSYLPERGGKLMDYGKDEIGFIVRNAEPEGVRAKKIVAMIPGFSLFSKDRLTDEDSIIIQILKNHDRPVNYLLNNLILPILDIFFGCLYQGGLLLELHSQNFLIGVDDNCNIISIVVRDLESTDKDISLMNMYGLEWKLKSEPYKCIYETDYNYAIKHSFMYDHKLGEYFFDPLLTNLKQKGIIQGNVIEDVIKDYVNANGYIKDSLFPPDRWYKFKNTLINRRVPQRPYISFQNLKYR